MTEIRYDAPEPILNIHMNPLAHSEWFKSYPDHAYDEYDEFVNLDKIPADDVLVFLKTLWKNIETPQEVIKDEFNGWAYEEGKWTKIDEPNELCYGYCECVGAESVFYAWDYYNFKWYILMIIIQIFVIVSEVFFKDKTRKKWLK